MRALSIYAPREIYSAIYSVNRSPMFSAIASHFISGHPTSSQASSNSNVSPQTSASVFCRCDDGKNVVSSKCRECNEDLCDVCVVAHKRVTVTRGHQIVKVQHAVIIVVKYLLHCNCYIVIVTLQFYHEDAQNESLNKLSEFDRMMMYFGKWSPVSIHRKDV